MNSRVPARIDRDALDRVLRRAAELQAHGRDIGEGLTEGEVLDLGREVGIPEAQLRQALLEEQTRVSAPAPSGMLDRWVAPGAVIAERVVQGTSESVGAALTRYFEQHEVLVVQRSTMQRIDWEQASTFAGAMKRIGWTFNANKARPFLDKAELVTAWLHQLEPGYCHVTLVASLYKVRAAYLMGGGGVTAAGGLGGMVLAAAGGPVGVGAVLAVAALAGGWSIARAFRPIGDRTRLGLERALDEVERLPALPAVSAGVRPLARDLGEVVREITSEVRRAFREKS